jgi:hypothetical protein
MITELGNAARTLLDSGPAFRYAVAALFVLVGLASARLRLRASAGLVACLVTTIAGLWILHLGRPYGVLVDVPTTRGAAAIAIAGSLRDPVPSILAGGPATADGGLRARLAAMGVPVGWLQWGPSLLPLWVLPLLGLVVSRLANDSVEAWAAALLWLAFATTETAALAGQGVVGGLWTHPTATLLVVATLLALWGADRHIRSQWAARITGAFLLATIMLWPIEGATLRPLRAVWLLTWDQGWLGVLALLGLPRLRRAAPLLLGASALVVVFRSLEGADVWGAHALYRVGIVLAAAGPFLRATQWLGETAARLWPGLRALSARPAGLGLGLALSLALPGSFVAWWDPPSDDVVAAASMEPVPGPVIAAAAYVSRSTPASAVFAAGTSYTEHVAVLGGRRVVRAPGLFTAPDDHQRRRAERVLVTSCDQRDFPARYEVTHLLLAPGDFREYDVSWPGDLARFGCLRAVFTGASGIAIYEVVR